MKKYAFLFLLMPLLNWAQSPTNQGRTFSEEIPERFQINSNELREYVYNKIPEDYRNETYPRSTFRFADEVAKQTSFIFSNASLYSDWLSLENYVNEILQKVLPEELKGEEYIHAYIVKDGSYNAFVTPTGMTFVQIGFFDAIETEATLAGVLAHELAHFYFNHSLKGYVKAESGDFKPGLFFKRKNAYNNFSVKNELQADSLAMVWMTDAGYSVKGLVDAFEISERWEENVLLQYKDLWELKETTHPRSEKRLKKLEDFANGDTKGAMFMVGEQKFKSFKKLAKTEILRTLLADYQFKSCIEKAFKYHIYDPNNPDYVYYLMEAIRKMCYLDHSTWDENFITNFYYEVKENDNGHKEKIDIEDDLFAEFPATLLQLKPEAYASVEAKFYWEEVKFKTYHQAFHFFNQIAELLEIKECALSMALTLNHREEDRKKYLQKYLAYKDIEHRDFAEAFLNRTLQSSLRNKTLTVFNEAYTVIKQGKENILIRPEGEENSQFLNEFFERVATGFENREHIFLEDLYQNKSNDYLKFLEMEMISFTTLVTKTKTELHIFEPTFWEMMSKYNVNEVEFVNFSYFDNRKKEKTVEAYKDALSTDYESLLNEVKRSRYVDVLITSLREVEGGIMKLRYFGAEVKLGYKEKAYEQLIDKLKTELKTKDSRLAERDKKYREVTEAYEEIRIKEEKKRKRKKGKGKN